MPHPFDSFRLDKRRAVITGAASGIGKAIAIAFAQAGAQVVLLDLNAEKLAEAARAVDSAAQSFPCDVSSEDSVSQAFERIAAEGPCDILVNSAGIAHVGTIDSTSPEDFDRLFRVNVRGTYLCMRAAVRRMQAQQSGVILNMASIAATSGLPDRFAYSMSKGAVLSMTLSVARDYLASQIRCNCISPARIHTPFVDGFVARTYPGREAEMFETLARSQPIGRMGTIDEVALLALYLCSDASAFVTGADYPLDGGFFNLR
jgi:NAD(P)-dependent dehydrogenase (short-subunit alcohol dehydrogenase family)